MLVNLTISFSGYISGILNQNLAFSIHQKIHEIHVRWSHFSSTQEESNSFKFTNVMSAFLICMISCVNNGRPKNYPGKWGSQTVVQVSSSVPKQGWWLVSVRQQKFLEHSISYKKNFLNEILVWNRSQLFCIGNQ